MKATPVTAAFGALRQLRGWLLPLAITLAGAAHGQGLAGTGPVTWHKLSPAQRTVLAPLEHDWKTISAPQQQKWIQVANRFPALPVDERNRVQRRIYDWSRLTPQERATTRLNFQEARQLSPQERQQQWEAYRALPADQRRTLSDEASRARPAATTPRKADSSVKSNVSRLPAASAAQPVGPTVVRRGAGATTNLVSKPATPPLRHQAGLPKVAAAPGFVDSTTLLPTRGAQGVAAGPRAAGDAGATKAQ